MQLNAARSAATSAATRLGEMEATIGYERARHVEFLAFIAHELRNPLTPIRTVAALLTLARPDDLVRAQRIIDRQVAQMSRMIDDLLDVSRASTGKLRLVLAPVQIDELIDAAVAIAEPAMAKRHQVLKVERPVQGGEMRADLMRLTQVLANLLDNASKYSPDRQTIRLSVRVLEGDVEILVMDDGIGISTGALGEIFRPFVQDEHALSFNTSGLGVGLAVVRELVEAHGGTVTAISRGIGHGSQFKVTLPMAVPEGR